MWSVIAFTDEPIVELGLQQLLRLDPEFNLIGVCRSRVEFMRAAEEHKPELLLYAQETDPTLSVARELRRAAPQAALVVWSREVPAELAHRAIEVGVRGFVCPSASHEIFRE